MKISLPVDEDYNDRAAETNHVWRTYFGECSLFFVHSYEGDILSYFTMAITVKNCFFRIWEDVGPFEDVYTEIELNDVGVPYGLQSYNYSGTLYKKYVADVECIDCQAGYIPSTMLSHRGKPRFYYVYPGMIPNDIQLGNMSQL